MNRTRRRAMKINDGIVLDRGRNVMGKPQNCQSVLSFAKFISLQTQRIKIVSTPFVMIRKNGNFS